jgi:hypothetical protein
MVSRVSFPVFTFIGTHHFWELVCLCQNIFCGYEYPALVITEQRCFAGRKKKRSESCDGDHAGARSSDSVKETMTVGGIVTRIDLLEFISKGPID